MDVKPVGHAPTRTLVRSRRILLAVTSALTGLLFINSAALADTTTATQAARIVQQYSGVWTAPPQVTNADIMDTPMLGNGDLGVAVSGTPDAQTYFLEKNDFWSLNNKKLQAMIQMHMNISGMSGATYSMAQNLAKGEADGTFSLSGNQVQTESWVQATDTTNNFFITKLTYTGSASQTVTINFAVGTGNSFASSSGSSGDVLYFDARADSVDTVSGFTTHKVRSAARVIGATGTVSGGNLTFTMAPGGTYYVVTSTMENTDSSSYQTQAISNISTKVAADIQTLSTSHQSWWTTFYGSSFVEIPDKTIEKEFYGSEYLLASASRSNEYAPAIWGNWVSRNPSFDYTLNYNYEVPFYFALTTNHLDLIKPYDKVILDWLPNAQAEATANGWTGAFYRVHIGPLPNGAADTNTWNQKSIGSWAATDMILRYYYTRDTAYANSGVYTWMKQVALFWQNYLVFDGTRYVITNDAQHEGNADPETNGVMSLGLLRLLLQGCIDMSTDLNVDASLRATWQNILNNLSAFPTQTRNGQTVFRYTEVGLDWNDGNAIGIQHIYPGSQIGLDSDATTLGIAQNMVGQMARWNDQNGTPTFYPAAARVGYDPNAILTNLHSWIVGNSYPSTYIHTSGGGLENFNTTPATLGEMFIQSYQGKIRIFPDWPTGTDAKFGDLGAYGGFLVSSWVTNNTVQYVRFVSSLGRSLTFHNPWPGQTLALYRNGTASGTLTGTDITITTSANEIIHVAPNGTSYATILNLMSLPGPTAPPTGTVVTGDASCASNEVPAGAIDGSTSTKWCSNADVGAQWLAIDFLNPKTINRWIVDHASTGGETTDYNTKNFKLQKSTDGLSWTDVDTVTNNTAAVTDRNVTSFSSRYVRLFITTPTQTTNTAARIYELQFPNPGTSLGTGTLAYGDANCAANEIPSNAIDGSTSTKWCSNADTGAQWLMLDLGTAQTIKEWVVDHASTGGETTDYNTKNFQLQKSIDGTTWVNVDTVTNNTAAVTDRMVTPFTSRFVRLFITVPTQNGNTAARIYEFQLH